LNRAKYAATAIRSASNSTLGMISVSTVVDITKPSGQRPIPVEQPPSATPGSIRSWIDPLTPMCVRHFAQSAGRAKERSG